MSFYKKTKGDLLKYLKGFGFSADRLGEGATKKIDSERTCVVLMNGVWSHIEIKVGIRFESINKNLYKIALGEGWERDDCSFFKMKQTSLFYIKIGDFCENKDDLGVFCPSNSTIGDVDVIKNIVMHYVKELNSISNVEAALDYYMSNDCFDPYGCMIYCAAIISGRRSILENNTNINNVKHPILSSKEIESLVLGCLNKVSIK